MNDAPDIQPVIYQAPDAPSKNPLRKLISRLGHLSTRTRAISVAAVLACIVAGTFLLMSQPNSKPAVTVSQSKSTTNTLVPTAPKVTTFAECKAAAGSTLTSDTPQKCVTKDGVSFTDTTTPVATPPKSPAVSPKPSSTTAASGGTSGTSTSGGGTVATGSGLNCPNPIFTTSWPQTQYGGWQDVSGNRVNANVLTGAGGSNSQVLNVCSLTNWNVVANFANNGGSINTYPDTQYDLTTDKTIAQYTSLNTCFGSKPPTPSGPQWPTPGGSEWDYAYDVWINHTAGENIWSNDIEIMVWNDWTDNIYPPAIGNVANGGSRAVTIDGIAYHMFQGGGGNEWIYTRDIKTTSGCFDMLNIMKDLVANQSAAAGITLASAPQHIEYGVEIAGTYGTQTFQITNASLTVQ